MFVLERILLHFGFRFRYNVIVGNVLVFMLEVNQAYARYLPPCNVVFDNVIVFVLEETLECLRLLLLYNVFVSNMLLLML